MKRFAVVGVVALCGFSRLQAQSSIDVLEDDLQQAKQLHDSTNSQVMTTFLSTLQDASQNPNAALELYKKAGGTEPGAVAVKSRYEYETPTERDKREAADAANLESAANVIEVHCGMMRNAGLLVVTPKAPGVQDQWLDWLKSTAAIYPQLTGHRELKHVTMSDSVISSYLGFHGWGASEQGGWSVSDVPQLYRTMVLEPLRRPLVPGAIDAWNIYIAMREADEPDKDKWAQEEPALDFDRDEDDYIIQPSMDKLAALDAIIKANPTDDHLDDWIKRMQAMIDSYRRGGTTTGLLPGATPSTPSSEAPGAIPAASPGTPTSGTTAPVPGATPGTPSSGGNAPTPTGT